MSDLLPSDLQPERNPPLCVYANMPAVFGDSSHPGTPSTVVTKELASLWHMMPKQEKRVYWSVSP